MKDELKKLIEAALTDGVLTAKEREVILKKAVALGEDPDEIDIYLDAEVQKVEQKSDAAIRQAKGKACPYCGASIPQLADKCPECGNYITPEASKELEEIIEELESALVDFKSGYSMKRNKAVVEKYSRKAKMYYNNHPKIKVLLSEVEKEMSAAESSAKKQALINGTLKNKWFWCVFLIVMGLLLQSSDIGGFLVFGGIVGLIIASGLYRNKWFWCALPIVLGAVMIASSSLDPDDEDFGFVGGLSLIVGGLIGLSYAGGLHKN